MKTNFWNLFYFPLVIACSIVTNQTSAHDGLSANSNMERAGLTNEWFSHIKVGARSNIVNMQLQVNEDIATRYYLVEYNGNVERISQFDLDAFGKPLGIENAEAHANTRKEIITAELAAQGRTDIEIMVRPISLPQTTIYAVTTNGHVVAVDADTGKHLWHTKVGNSRYLTSGVGASKSYVAVVNGSTVYCLSASEGKMLWSKTCRRAPSAAPSVSETAIYVPLIDGRLEVFSVADKGGFPKSFVSFGASVSKPLLTESTVSWATSNGFYAVALADGNAIRYRLNSGSNIVSGGTADNGMIYVATTGGSIFALDEMNGSIFWEYSTGDRITSAPFVKSGSVFAISSEKRLYKIDATRGLPAEGWETPIEGVRQFVGMSKDRIYLLNNLGQLIAIDYQTGAQVASVAGPEITMVIPNQLTDRIYVGSNRGLIQCFRESGNTYPVFHANDDQMAGGADKMKKDMKEPAPDSDDDPFAAEADPFAAESDPFAAEDSSDDPFAAEDSSGDVDDGGDDDDPFGGDSSDDGGDGSGDDGDQSDDPFGG